MVGPGLDENRQPKQTSVRGRPVSSLDISSFLDAQLNHMFGASFAPVIEFEASKELGVNLYDALRENPSQAFGLLHKIFKRSEAVNLIVDRLTERLHHLHTAPESSELLALLARGRDLSDKGASRIDEGGGPSVESREYGLHSESFQFSGVAF